MFGALIADPLPLHQRDEEEEEERGRPSLKPGRKFRGELRMWRRDAGVTVVMVTFRRLDKRREGHFLFALCEKNSCEDEKTAATQKPIFLMWTFRILLPLDLRQPPLESSSRERSAASRCVNSLQVCQQPGECVILQRRAGGFHARAAELFKMSPNAEKRGFNRQMALIGNLVWDENTSYCAVRQTVSIFVSVCLL